VVQLNGSFWVTFPPKRQSEKPGDCQQSPYFLVASAILSLVIPGIFVIPARIPVCHALKYQVDRYRTCGANRNGIASSPAIFPIADMTHACSRRLLGF
jgi:hypothetical protein